MDVHDYEYIVAIAEHGSISKAAQQLYITQSALSRFLQRTEEELGMELFSRQGKSFRLTSAGAKYVETGRLIINLDRQLTEELEKDRIDLHKRIQIGIGMGRIDNFTAGILKQFREIYPNVTVFLKADTSRKNKLALINEQIDMALLVNQEHMPGYNYEVVETSRLGLLARRDSELAKLAIFNEQYPFPVIPAHAIDGQSMITLPQNTNSGNMVLNYLKKNKLNPHIALEMSDIRSMVNAVAEGIGYAMLMSVPLSNNNLCYLSLEGMEQIEQKVELVYHSDLTLTKPMKEMIRLMRENDENTVQ